MSDFIRVTMAPDNLDINPGETAEVVITMQNASNVVDLFLIEVQGLDSSWFKLSVPNSSLMPRMEGTSTLTITPPKSSAAIANDYPFTVKVTSQKDPTQESVVSGKLEVKPFYSYSLDINPQRMTGPKGQYSLIITNNGNAELDFNLEGLDPEDLCHFYFETRQPRVAPGETAEILLDVEPSRRPFKGRPKLYSFTLTATPNGDVSEPKTVPGGLEVTPRFGEWLTRTVGTLARRRSAPRLPRVGTRRIVRGAPGAAGAVSGSGFRRLLPVVVASLVVVGIVIVAIFLFTRGGGGFEGEFLIDPGSDINFGVPLPDSSPVKIRATADWSGGAEFLEVILLAPDGSPVRKPLQVSSDNPSVDFKLDEDLIARRVDGWVLNLKNTSDTSQADGTLKISFSSLK